MSRQEGNPFLGKKGPFFRDNRGDAHRRKVQNLMAVTKTQNQLTPDQKSAETFTTCIVSPSSTYL